MTHDMTWVTEFCTRAILIEDGRVTMDGAPEEVVRTHKEHSAATACGAAGADRADAPRGDRHRPPPRLKRIEEPAKRGQRGAGK